MFIFIEIPEKVVPKKAKGGKVLHPALEPGREN
jgi:hypothetical protein